MPHLMHRAGGWRAAKKSDGSALRRERANAGGSALLEAASPPSVDVEEEEIDGWDRHIGQLVHSWHA